MTTSSEPVLTQAETVALIVKLAESIYAAHVHGGKANVSMFYALQAAATTIGAAQSDIIAGYLQAAINDPVSALKSCSEMMRANNRKVESDRNQKIDRLASAMERSDATSSRPGKLDDDRSGTP